MKLKLQPASKLQQDELLAKATRLGENFDPLLPVCRGKCVFCPFTKMRKRLKRVQNAKSSKSKLKWYSNWGDQLARAYAVMLQLRLIEKMPFLVRMNTPVGSISFVLRGKVRKEKLIGVQYFDNPKFRLFMVADLAKRGYHFYSLKDRYVCTGLVSKPPPEFVTELIHTVPYKLVFLENRFYLCSHLSPESLRHKTKDALVINWRTANRTIGLCASCVSGETKLLAKLSERLATPSLEQEFELEYIWGLCCRTKCSDCLVTEKKMFLELKKRYFSGELTDSGLLSECLKRARTELVERRKAVYIRGRDCFGNDKPAFISSLNPADEERLALDTLLEMIETGVVVDTDATPNKVMAQFWPQYGAAVIRAILPGDEKLVAELLTAKQPSQILKAAFERKQKREILLKLPKYVNLSPVARFADTAARLYRIGGEKRLLSFIDKAEKKEMSTRGLAYAFLLILGEAQNKRWQYTKEQIEFGEFLRKPAEELLNCAPENYHFTLQKLLTASGVTEELRLYPDPNVSG